MKNKVYIKDWLSIKPYQKHTDVDIYYLDICNAVYSSIRKHHNYKTLKYLLSEKDIKSLSVIIVCYFEDIISNVGIWKTFTKLHQKQYGKPLPYYNLDNYEREQTNVQDISFIIWNYINTYSVHEIINPNDYIAVEFSPCILDVLDKEWQYAPENEKLAEYFQLKDYEGKDEFYIVRAFIEKIMFDSWLLAQDFLNEMIDKFKEFENNEDVDDYMLEKYMYDAKDSIVLNSKSKLLNLYGKDWAANYLTESHKLYNDILHISTKLNSIFKLKKETSKYYIIIHLATDQEFQLLKSSLDMLEKFRYDKLYFLGIVKWKSEWLFSGILSELDYSQDIIDREKNTPVGPNTVSFATNKDREIINDVLDKQLKAFKSTTGGELIKILPAREVEQFFNQYNFNYQKIIGVSSDKMTDPPNDVFSAKFNNNEDIVVIFFNSKGGLENYFNIESAFPIHTNIFFDEDYAYEDIDDLIKSDFISPELVEYCFQEFKDNMYYKEYIEENPWVEDFKFSLTYYRKNTFETIPKITLTNK